MVLLLLNTKVDVEAKDSANWTALFFASIKGYSEVIKLLLETGKANSNAEDLDRPL